MQETELVEEVVNALILLLNAALELESGGKSEGLLDSEVLEDDVILHNVRGVLGESLRVQGVSVVEHDLSTQHGSLGSLDSVTEYVKERCFTGTRGSHDEAVLAGQCHTRHLLEDVELLVLTIALLSLASVGGHSDLVVNISKGELNSVLKAVDGLSGNVLKVLGLVLRGQTHCATIPRVLLLGHTQVAAQGAGLLVGTQVALVRIRTLLKVVGIDLVLGFVGVVGGVTG